MESSAVPPAESDLYAEPDLKVPARAPRTGALALLLGILAVAMGACPWLPESFPPGVRFFPLYLVVPVGICAVVAGFGALRDLRRVPEAGRGRARAAIALGAVAVVVPVGLAVWGISVLGP
ncbi:hypothetical protein [Streptomyces sp. NPDC047014]|uniref:hypothetical protein n=1 Tax=Streptomyces sp. NPDC047014 TaxID=3155736 RepID=UPI0033F30919